MSTFALKMIAIITMLIDHIGAIFISPQNSPYLYLLFRSVGRLAFPIFCFLIVEGFYNTKNVKKYMIRLGIFALISEIPFDLAFYRGFHGTDINFSNIDFTTIMNFMSHQNVFFTLFLGLLLITIMNKVEKKYQKHIILNNLINGLVTIAFCIMAAILRTDYDFKGILLIAAFYLFRGNKVLLGMAIFLVLGYIGQNAFWGICATLSIIAIAFYNEKKGKDIKYLFYIFYPAHLFILYLISLII